MAYLKQQAWICNKNTDEWKTTKNMLWQDRQCTSNITLRRVRATTVVVESQEVLHTLSVYLQYPARNVHALDCHLWLVRLWYIFSTLFHKRHDFRKRLTEYKMWVLIFSTTFAWNIPHSKKNWARCDKKFTLVFMYSTNYSCQILIKLESSPHVSEKYSSIKFNENPSSGSRVVPCGQTDMTKPIDAFRNFAKND